MTNITREELYQDFELWECHCVPVIDIAAEYGDEIAREYQEWIYFNEK